MYGEAADIVDMGAPAMLMVDIGAAAIDMVAGAVMEAIDADMALE